MTFIILLLYYSNILSITLSVTPIPNFPNIWYNAEVLLASDKSNDVLLSNEAIAKLCALLSAFCEDEFTQAASSLHPCHKADNAKLDKFKRFCAFNWLAALVIVVLAVLIVLLHSTFDWSITLWFCWLNCCLWFSTVALNWFNTCALSALAFSTAILFCELIADILLFYASANWFIASDLAAFCSFICADRLE